MGLDGPVEFIDVLAALPRRFRAPPEPSLSRIATRDPEDLNRVEVTDSENSLFPEKHVVDLKHGTGSRRRRSE